LHTSHELVVESRFDPESCVGSRVLCWVTSSESEASLERSCGTAQHVLSLLALSILQRRRYVSTKTIQTSL